jgi:uncharacterized protein YndB with AHSA1/START domain
LKDRAIDITIRIECPADEIFRALTDPALVKLWWHSPDFYSVTEFHMEHRTGGDWSMKALSDRGKQFEVRGQVLEYDPPKTLALTWNPTFQQIATTTVRFTLTPEAGSTIVHLLHSGFRSDSIGYETHLYGWPHILEWLIRYMAP